MKLKAILIAVVVCCAGPVHPLSAETIKAYHIGNSLTDNMYYNALKQIATRGNDTYIYGKHVSSGAPLDFTWQMKARTGLMYSVPPYGLYQNALKNYTWNVMTLEPFYNRLTGTNGDLQISENFINYAKKKSPNIQTYIYERWPERTTDEAGNYQPFDYSSLWDLPYTGSTSRKDPAIERRGYFETLVNLLNKAMPNARKPVRMVPVGDVLAELDDRIKADRIDGITDITQLYADHIHLNKTGAYVISLTFYATMFKSDPVGQTVPGAFGTMSSKLAHELQDTVWDVVSTHPYAGVASFPAAVHPNIIPEPVALGAILLLPLILRRRARKQA